MGLSAVTFSEISFFYFILPPIIFAAGYNLKHKHFIRNLDKIMILGILGTIIAMFILSTILIVSNEYLIFQGSKIKLAECLLLVRNTFANILIG